MPHQICAKASATREWQHANPANAADRAICQHSGCTHWLIIQPRQKVGCPCVQIIPFLVFSHALFLNKNSAPKRMDMGKVRDRFNAPGHAK
jgi:hypothetical protein